MNNFFVHTLHGNHFITRSRVFIIRQITILLNSIQCSQVNIHEMMA